MALGLRALSVTQSRGARKERGHCGTDQSEPSWLVGANFVGASDRKLPLPWGEVGVETGDFYGSFINQWVVVWVNKVGSAVGVIGLCWVCDHETDAARTFGRVDMLRNGHRQAGGLGPRLWSQQGTWYFYSNMDFLWNNVLHRLLCVSTPGSPWEERGLKFVVF